jgi:sulfate transport system substrate-binding protein
LKQARSIVEGLAADVVTFNQVPDIDFLVKNGLVSDDWQKEFPNQSSPWYSLPSFLVRAGNPKNIKDWGDLVRDDVQVIFPESQNLGQRALYLSRRYRLGEGEFQGRRDEGEGICHHPLQPCARVRHGRPRGDDNLRRA